MRPTHLSSDDIGRFRRGELAPDEVLLIGRHLGECSACRSEFDSGPAFATLRDALTRDAEEKPRHAFIAAIAATVAAAAITALFFPRHEPPRRDVPPHRIARIPVSATGYGRPDWDAALQTRHSVAPPILAELRPPFDALRGNDKPRRIVLEPEGIVIESDQPHFTWPRFAHATFVVSVFEDSKPVAESGKIAVNSWMPAKTLPRGKTYTWQVEVQRGDDISIVPAPPLPPAMFRVVDAATLRDIDEAKRRFPDDHLLLGVLYAKAGLQRKAIDELSASNDPRAKDLLDEVRGWR
jgi:hypothetical protein